MIMLILTNVSSFFSFDIAYENLYNNHMNVRTLVGQSAMVYCANKLMEIFRISFELLYKCNRPQVSTVIMV